MTMVLMAIDAGADAHRTPHKAQYPDNAGWIVRTGETYTYDTPYHKGNSPNPKGSSPSASQDLWVDFITELRALVCVKHQKQLFFRGWDNWSV